jgi:hypothetical protein
VPGAGRVVAGTGEAMTLGAGGFAGELTGDGGAVPGPGGFAGDVTGSGGAVPGSRGLTRGVGETAGGARGAVAGAAGLGDPPSAEANAGTPTAIAAAEAASTDTRCFLRKKIILDDKGQ